MKDIVKTVIYLAIIVASLYGEIRCVYKAVTCNWEPIGKAEVVYTAAALCGAGSIVGWFNIKDN